LRQLLLLQRLLYELLLLLLLPYATSDGDTSDGACDGHR
jgi:hypothetical protein